MEKVYTVTFQRVLNYGAVLQAYALMRFLQEEGYDAEVLDYAPSYFLIQTCRPAKGIKKTLDKIKKYKKFSEFRNKFMKLTPKTYLTKNSLKTLPVAHAAVCGSDQIWNCKLTGNNFDSTYFLDFAPTETKRIAYAASAGSIRISESAKSVESVLSKFDNIGTREAVLAADVKEIVPSSKPEVVVDPCLLIKDYSEVFDSTRVPETPYVVTYVVGSGEMLEKFNDRVLEFKKLTNIPIIHIGAKPIKAADQNILDIGPSEWASFIKKATYVVTNSFHGTAFSVNFEKNFLFIPHVVENLNSRQVTLLENVDLIEQMINPESNISELPEIDYELVNVKLERIVSESKSYLLSSLSNESQNK
ncbi:Polysaccharide pyruvyl transferase [Vibrio coralliirubri]|uniref:polysaccharide pyruvyl transferase family protein n=1 Tax=Vibrio coralliirubri TaxID=1516159 RepID=UPI000639E06A|nr:polysaccharide pyruvyl transferase family protein [Vibrio coralliirubri]CDT89241.1 Polysaccharide pyruvyl transferase [Vibrio coralliirubri]